VFKIPRGTRDFTPVEMQKRRYVEEIIRKTFQKFGYKEIQTPTFETLELFTAKSGEAIINEMYIFKDKASRDLALRPELTAPVMRFYVDKLQMEPKPLKLFYFGNCFRYDRPQKGRYREFMQAGCELIGADTPEAYAELIALAFSILKNVGLKNIKLNIGNLNILSHIFKIFNITKEQKNKLIPLIDKSNFDEIILNLKEYGLSETDIKKFIEVLQTSDFKIIFELCEKNPVIKNEIIKLNEILELLKNIFEIKNYEIKISIVRGLDYYKGIVFEIDAPILGAEKQLCGGGEYELIPLFGGKETPTSGFAIGFDRTILALELEKYVFPQTKLDYYIIPVNEQLTNKSLEITHNLRKQGFFVDVDLLKRGLSKSLKYASSINVDKIIIIGEKELKNESVTIRDMKTGRQELIKIDLLYKKNKLS
jgi:histidyl-tRNA synthetase